MRALRRVLGLRPIASVTPLGWALLAGAVVAGIPGWLFGWLEFRALSVMCLVAMTVAVLSVLGRREHEVLFELSRPRVQVGDVATGELQVRSEKTAEEKSRSTLPKALSSRPADSAQTSRSAKK